jgi:uncharacterized protein YdeI (YjbR/CyaY-like superfamily)
METPTFFATAAEFRRWLHRHHARKTELWVGFHRKGSGRKSLTWPESVDQALCYGWIDGIRKSIDETSYKIRFTPRRATSIWSAVNIRRVAELIDAGLMQPAGRAAFENRDPRKAGLYSFERESVAFDAPLRAQFEAAADAWTFFNAQPPSYRKPATHWVMSAKKEETRQKRLRALIEDSAAGLRIKQLRRP